MEENDIAFIGDELIIAISKQASEEGGDLRGSSYSSCKGLQASVRERTGSVHREPSSELPLPRSRGSEGSRTVIGRVLSNVAATAVALAHFQVVQLHRISATDSALPEI